MKMNKKLIAAILSLSLATAPISGVSAAEASSKTVQPVESVQEVMSSMVDAVALDLTETPLVTTPVTETPLPSSEMSIYNLDGAVVTTPTPYYYKTVAQMKNPKVNTYEVKVPLNYGKDAVIPIKVNNKGALIYALAAEYTDVDLDYYSLYSDAACTKIIYTSDKTAYLPKAGTYYIKVSKYDLSKIGDSTIAAAFGFVSGANQVLKNKSSVVSAFVDSEQPVYYKVAVTKSTKLTFKVTGDNSAYATLCNSKKQAITDKDYVYSTGGKLVYVVGKGSYYLKLKSYKGLMSVSSTFTTVANASGASKAKAATLKMNGKTRNALILPGDSTKRVYYFKFTNSKKQKVYLNVTSSYTAGKMQLEFFDAKGKSYGTDTIYDGINMKHQYTPYVYSYMSGSSSRTLPKGTYYVRFKKMEKKTTGILQVNVKNKKK